MYVSIILLSLFFDNCVQLCKYLLFTTGNMYSLPLRSRYRIIQDVIYICLIIYCYACVYFELNSLCNVLLHN